MSDADRAHSTPSDTRAFADMKPIDAAEAERRQRIYAAVHELREAFRQHPEAVIDHAKLLYDPETGLPRE